MKYLIVGGLNTILTTVIYAVFLKLLHINYFVSLIISWFSGVLFTYALNFLWVFKPEKKLIFKGRFPKYFTTYTTSLVFNIIALHALVTFKLDPFYAQVILMPFIICFNFLANKFWSLRRDQMKDSVTHHMESL